MYLLICKHRHNEKHMLYNSRDNAAAEGLAFIGKHNPDDGCSSEPKVKNSREGQWRASRTSSWGEKTATVIDLGNALDERE